MSSFRICSQVKALRSVHKYIHNTHGTVKVIWSSFSKSGSHIGLKKRAHFSSSNSFFFCFFFADKTHWNSQTEEIHSKMLLKTFWPLLLTADSSNSCNGNGCCWRFSENAILTQYIFLMYFLILQLSTLQIETGDIKDMNTLYEAARKTC